MPLNHLFVLALALALSSTVYADSPFVGKWKIDEAASHIAGTTDSVTAVGPNTWKFQYGSFSWTIKANGTDQPTPFGTTAIKVVSPTVWQFTDKSNDRVTATETWTLSADGKTMTRTFNGQKEDGEPFSGGATVKRIAGTTGFAGTWQSTEVTMTFTEIDISPNGEDGITVLVPADGTTYTLKFDGKDYPEVGPRIPDGLTVSAKRTGTRNIQVTTKLNGKTFDSEEWKLSADGKTFTYIQHDSGTDQPMLVILHRSGNP